MKKLLSTIMALVMLLSLVPMAVATEGVTEENAVARIGDQYYETLEDAVLKVANGDTITLLKDVALGDNHLIIGSVGSEQKVLTLDLNGHSISATNLVIRVQNANLTVTGPGKIYETSPYYGAILIKGSDNAENKDYTVVTVGAGVELEGWSPIFVDQYKECAYGVAVNVDGAKLTGKRDTSGDMGNAIYVNGTIKDQNNAPKLVLNNVTQTTEGTGMYLAGYTDTTITGGSITGGNTGIEIRAGELTVNGATVVGNGVPTKVTPNDNGSTTNGAGIAVAQHTTKLPIKVTINSGDISGYSALYQSNPQNNDDESVEKVSVAVNGGTFKAINGGTCGVYSENNCVAVTGGTFSSNPSAYVADKSLEVSKDTAGQYTVSKKTNAAETSEVKLPAARTEGTTEAKIDKGDIDTGKDLTVSSEVASVTINQKGVEAIGNNSDLTLTVKTVDQPNDANKAAYDEAIKGNDTASAIVVDIKLSAGSGNAFTQAVEGAYALVTVKYDASGKADKLKVFYLNGSVKQELTKVNDAANGAVNTFSYDDTNKEITMKLPHFSQYLITTTATTSGGNTSGGNSVIKTGAGSSAASGTHTVTTDLTPGSITKVTVDGKVVNAKYYTVSGSNVTFTAEFLKTLKNGSHTVTVENATKIAKGVFTVNNPTTAQSPTTADAGIALYAGMAIASVMGTGVVFTSRKRKNH